MEAAKVPRVALAPANLKVLKKYWDACYAHRDNSAPKAAYNRLKRAIESLGDVPLTATSQEIQAAVNKSNAGKPNRQRTCVSALRQILRWMGRTDIVLVQHRRALPKVKYLSLTDFEKVAGAIREDLRALAWVAITTGCRAGECFALTSDKYRPAKKTFWVDEQLDPEMNPQPVKNRRPREVPVLPQGQEHIQAWLAVDGETRAAIRGARLADEIKKACKTIWPKESAKHLKFHDLRHSYAIHMLNQGVPIGLVAQAIGDSVQVTQENYLGFCLADEGIASIQRILKA